MNPRRFRRWLLAATLATVLLPGVLFADRDDDRRGHQRPNPARAAKANGCQGHPDVERPGHGEPAAHVRLAGAYRDKTERHGPHFASQGLAAVKIRVKWNHLPKGGTQRLELFAPSGDLYGAYTARVSDKAMHETVLPVGGWITEHSLYGGWCLEVFLSGEPGPIVRRKFVIGAR